jgi:hypothetical protein
MINGWNRKSDVCRRDSESLVVSNNSDMNKLAVEFFGNIWRAVK